MRMEEVARHVLKRAREIISSPERWTKKAFARDAEGTNLKLRCGNGKGAGDRIARHRDAVCWCPDGAIRKALAELHASNRYPDAKWDLVRALARHGLWDALVKAGAKVGLTHDDNHRPTMWSWNDEKAMTHEAVLEAFDIAIDEPFRSATRGA